jgi:intracellular septation protein
MMKFLFDLFPVILFFVAFKLADIYVATLVAIAATIAQIVWLIARRKKVEGMQWASLILIVFFTVLYWLFAAVLFFSAQFFKKNWIESLMGKQITLKPDSPKSLWLKLNHAWALFFFFMGVLNIYVAYTFSEDIWVNFKLFGGIGLLIAFVIAQGLWLSRHMEAEQS